MSMNRELLVYANYDVAIRYKQKMKRDALICLLIGIAAFLLGLMYTRANIMLYFVAIVCLCLGALSYLSKDSMLNDVDNGLLVFKFTTEGWYRNESPVLYRWDDFKRVEFADRAIIFFEAKQHNIHSSVISPMLMTDSDFNVTVWCSRPAAACWSEIVSTKA